MNRNKNNYRMRSGGMKSATEWGQQRVIRSQDRYIDAFVSKLSLGSNVLEIGVGAGFFCEAALKRGREYTGIEPSDALREGLPQEVHQVRDLVPPIPFSDNTFELVYMEHVLEHMKNHGEAIDIISECCRVLVSGGTLSLIFPDYLRQRNLFLHWDYSHSYPTSMHRGTRLCAELGLIIRYSGGYVGVWRGRIFCRNSYILACLPIICGSKVEYH